MKLSHDDDTRDDFPLSSANTRKSSPIYPVIQTDYIRITGCLIRAFFTYLAYLRDSDPCSRTGERRVDRKRSITFFTFSAVRIIFYVVNSGDAKSPRPETRRRLKQRKRGEKRLKKKRRNAAHIATLGLRFYYYYDRQSPSSMRLCQFFDGKTCTCVY